MPPYRALKNGIRRVLVACFSRYRRLPGWAPNLFTTGLILLAVRLYAAIASPIADCDETYNYWEPLHFLLYGYGLQTWEYDPRYALRSYAFLLPYAGVARLIGAGTSSKLAVFRGLRMVQALASALAELFLYDSVVWRFGKLAALLFLALVLGSAGMFRASIELLPSSWAMISLTTATAHWLVGEYDNAILGVAVAAVLGWPFAALLGMPLFLHAAQRLGLPRLLRLVILYGAALSLLTLAVDSWYYGRPTISPLNLMLYNVVPQSGAGPDIFGTEEWTYYAKNLLLNLDIGVLGLVLYPILWLVDGFLAPVWENHRPRMMERIIFLSPAFLWLFVLGNQPHKEERFMVPVYPFVCLVTAVTISDILLASLLKMGRPRWSRALGLAAALAVAGLSIAAGASRAYSQVAYYHAPMTTFTRLVDEELQNGAGPRLLAHDASTARVTVCLGSEWYRFPSHFALPRDARFRVGFVDAGFDGQLPKYFAEGAAWGRLGSRAPTTGFNMFNRADPAQFVSNASDACDYFVAFVKHGAPLGDGGSDNPIAREEQVVVLEEPFLDAEATGWPARALWVPGYSEPRLRFGRYVLVRNSRRLPLQSSGWDAEAGERELASHRDDDGEL